MNAPPELWLGADYRVGTLWDYIDGCCADDVDFYGGDFADLAEHLPHFWRSGKRLESFQERHRAGELACRLAGLGVAARTRHDAFPDLEALVESGLRFSATIWRGIAVPAGSDDARVAGLRAALREVADDSGFRDLGLESGFAATWLDGEAWVARAEAERAEFAALWRETPWRPAGVG